VGENRFAEGPRLDKDCPALLRIGEQASKILSDYLGALVRVDGSGSRMSIRSTVPDLLCSCPHLKSMRAKNAFAKDITERAFVPDNHNRVHSYRNWSFSVC